MNEPQRSEWEAFLAAYPKTEFADVLLPDLCNIIRGKRIGRKQFDKFFGQGILLPSSTFLLDVNGIGTNAGGRGFSDGDPDVAVLPVAALRRDMVAEPTQAPSRAGRHRPLNHLEQGRD